MRALLTSARAAGRWAIAAIVAVLLLAPAAHADGTAVIQDCTQGGDGISGTYTQSEYKQALEMLSGDGDEYSDCRDQIREAQYAAARGGSSSAGGGSAAAGGVPGGSSNVAPAELGEALRGSGIDPGAAPGSPVAEPGPISVDGETIDLSDAGVPSIASALTLPLPLAASAMAVLFSALLPLVRYLAARFGAAEQSDLS